MHTCMKLLVCVITGIQKSTNLPFRKRLSVVCCKVVRAMHILWSLLPSLLEFLCEIADKVKCLLSCCKPS